MTGRDRDERGRARNARPRDAAGRPLPRGAAGVPRRPEGEQLEPEEALVEAQRLLDGGAPFPAHEVFEAVWKQARGPERELWRGLAQVAVGLTHLQRGNAAGAAALLDRGAQRVAEWSGSAPYDVDAAAVSTWARALARRVRDGAAGPGEVPRLVRR